jgi:hypothetical protein
VKPGTSARENVRTDSPQVGQLLCWVNYLVKQSVPTHRPTGQGFTSRSSQARLEKIGSTLPPYTRCECTDPILVGIALWLPLETVSRPGPSRLDLSSSPIPMDFGELSRAGEGRGEGLLS